MFLESSHDGYVRVLLNVSRVSLRHLQWSGFIRVYFHLLDMLKMPRKKHEKTLKDTKGKSKAQKMP